MFVLPSSELNSYSRLDHQNAEKVLILDNH